MGGRQPDLGCQPPCRVSHTKARVLLVMAALHTGQAASRSLQARHTRWPQFRNVSRGASQHTMQACCEAAAAISERAASTRRSVTRLLQGGRDTSAEQRWNEGRAADACTYACTWKPTSREQLTMYEGCTTRLVPCRCQDTQDHAALSPQARHGALDQLHQLLQLRQAHVSAGGWQKKKAKLHAWLQVWTLQTWTTARTA